MDLTLNQKQLDKQAYQATPSTFSPNELLIEQMKRDIDLIKECTTGKNPVASLLLYALCLSCNFNKIDEEIFQ